VHVLLDGGEEAGVLRLSVAGGEVEEERCEEAGEASGDGHVHLVKGPRRAPHRE
jgi:hypothetical protein